MIILFYRKASLPGNLAINLVMAVAFCLLLLSPLKAAEVLIGSLAKPKIVLLSGVTRNQLCHALSPTKSGCDKTDQINYIRSFKKNNNQVLLFFYLKDKTNKYHKGLSVAASLNSGGQWKVGKAFVGEPRRIIRDASGGLWMHAQYDNEGFSPRLLFSKEGLTWSEVELPVKNRAVYTLEKINKLCIENKTLFVTLQFMGSGEKVVSRSWKANLSSLFINAKNQQGKWQNIDKKMINSLSCNPITAINNTWLIHEGETVSLFQHAAKNLTVKIVHASNANDYAIQVGAYKNLLLAHELVLSLKKAGFDTFSKMLEINKGEKVKKIYVGPYSDRKAAAKKLMVLKTRFSTHKAMQSAFILKFK